MRQNFPVTQHEFVLPDAIVLLSTTDEQGRITYANEAFVEASGYRRDELIGQPHNIVRHPDMPPAAFADMWRVLKTGHPWTGVVKNRRKNGDHYWVRANAAPMVRDGRVVGYLSVRTKPTAAEVQACAAVYAELEPSKAARLGIRNGFVVRTGWMSFLDHLRFATAGARLWSALLAAAIATAAALTLPLAGTMAVMLVTFFALGLWLHGQLVAPVTQLLLMVNDVASGQTSAHRAHALLNRADELGGIARGISQSGLNLLSLIHDVEHQSANIGNVAHAIADGHRDLQSHTRDASSNLEHTAGAVEQLTQTVHQTAQAAQEARSLVAEANQQAEQGNAMVDAAVRTMQDIDAGARRINDIVAIIDGIAFQTNILALNAAVEAARAGAEGRGFAVVAAEVRTLAQRSGQAAREIRGLISTSVNQAQNGVNVVNEAGARIGELVRSVGEVSRIMERIADISTAQTDSVGKVQQAMRSLHDMTELNAGLVEQGNEAANHLRTRSDHLQEAIGAFAV